MFARQGSEVSSQTAAVRVILALVIPITAGVLATALVANLFALDSTDGQALTAVVLASIALSSWALGLTWYGSRGMGLKGGRPLTAGIGFAALAWVIFIVLRLVLVDIAELRAPNSGRTFVYLLLFEGLATQIWTFGLFFRAAAEWRGPLSGVAGGGILFGLVAVLFFQASAVATPLSILYFIIWGILYGLIRLRTGSLLGTALIGALQSFTAWIVFVPPQPTSERQLTFLFGVAAIAYLLLIWRLWPKTEEDYRL